MNREERMMMHRRNVTWLALVFALPLFLVLSARPTWAQGPEGDLDLTDIDPATLLDHFTHPPLDGGGDELWQGGSLEFPGEPGQPQRYRSVAATLSASRPECDGGTAQVTVSVRVENHGPNPGAGYSGALRLFEPVADPTNWEDHILAQHGVTVSAPVGLVETLTVTMDVPAEDLEAGDVFIHLALETRHGGAKTWTADELSATYAYDTAGCAPGIAMEKTGSGPDPLQVGDTVEYSFVVSNPGDFTLTNITVTDPLPGLSPIDCLSDTLAPDAEMTCTANYTVTQEDADTGFIENTATVSGDPPDGPSVNAEDGAVVPPSQKPGIAIEKTASGPDPLEVGATVNYEFLVTNTGNVTLSDINGVEQRQIE